MNNKNQLSINELAALVSGRHFMNTNAVPRLNIPSVSMADGPHGVRKQNMSLDNGVSGSEKATAFPTATLIASTWDEHIPYLMGKALADECKHYNVNIILGPGVNIKRNPLCGRNFEYFSEDPILSGIIGSQFVKGVQSEGIGVSMKHFALNNSENYRVMSNSIVDKRAAHEIYLKSFEIVVKEAKPASIMCSYNKINDVYASENKWLLTNVLRDEWRYEGIVLSDWGAVNDRVLGIQAGLDLEMPGDTTYCRSQIIERAEKDPDFLTALERSADRVKSFALTYGKKHNYQADFEKNHQLAIDIATQGAVLLKNDEGRLPLRKDKKFAVVGDLFQKMRYQGSGSSMINAYKIASFVDAFNERNIDYDYYQGYEEFSSKVNQHLIDDAISNINTYDHVIVFAGLTNYYESEAGDRAHMDIPVNQTELIQQLIKKGVKPIIVLFGGSPMALPFLNHVEAILLMHLAGQGVGEATTQLLFGEANPSGKLSETWPKTYKDVFSHDTYSKHLNEIYKESIFVGYRYYGSKDIEPAFHFGHGLSYTTFELNHFNVIKKDDLYEVSVDVTNTGDMFGSEVIQLYVQNNPNSKVFKAFKELKAFKKVHLESKEKKTITLSLDTKNLSYYHTGQDEWVLENGDYQLELCTCYDRVFFTHHIHITGEKEINSPYEQLVNTLYQQKPLIISDSDFVNIYGRPILQEPQIKPITLDSPIFHFKKTFFGKLIHKSLLGQATKQLKLAEKLPDGPEKDNKIMGAIFLERLLNSSSIRMLSMSAGNHLPFHVAQGMIHIVNGHILKGLKCMKKPYQVPALPDEIKE